MEKKIENWRNKWKINSKKTKKIKEETQDREINRKLKNGQWIQIITLKKQRKGRFSKTKLSTAFIE